MLRIGKGAAGAGRHGRRRAGQLAAVVAALTGVASLSLAPPASAQALASPFGGPVTVLAGLGATDGWWLADVDGDARLDLVTSTASSIEVRRQQADGALGAAVSIGLGSRALDAVGADVDGDGLDEVVVSTASTVVAIQGLEGGSPSSEPAGAAAPPGGLAATDVDGDGRDEVVAVVLSGLAVLERDAAGTWSSALVPDSSGGSAPTIVDDVSGDGVGDLVADGPGGAVAVFHSTGGSFGDRDLFEAQDGNQVDTERFPGRVATDLDGDGARDLAWSVRNLGCGRECPGGPQEALVLRIHPSADAASRQNVLLGAAASVAGATDLTGDGRPDLVLVAPGELLVVAAGEFSAGDPVRYPVAAGITEAQVADFDGDGDDDVVARSGPDVVLLPGGDAAPSGDVASLVLTGSLAVEASTAAGALQVAEGPWGLASVNGTVQAADGDVVDVALGQVFAFPLLVGWITHTDAQTGQTSAALAMAFFRPEGDGWVVQGRYLNLSSVPWSFGELTLIVN